MVAIEVSAYKSAVWYMIGWLFVLMHLLLTALVHGRWFEFFSMTVVVVSFLEGMRRSV